jgi:hypothetical protein
MKSLGRHLLDYAGSGMVLTGFLLGALALAAAPSALGSLAVHAVTAPAVSGR